MQCCVYRKQNLCAVLCVVFTRVVAFARVGNRAL